VTTSSSTTKSLFNFTSPGLRLGRFRCRPSISQKPVQSTSGEALFTDWGYCVVRFVDCLLGWGCGVGFSSARAKTLLYKEKPEWKSCPHRFGRAFGLWFSAVAPRICPGDHASVPFNEALSESDENRYGRTASRRAVDHLPCFVFWGCIHLAG